MTLAQFDNHYELLYSHRHHQVPEFDLQPRGGTALLDATGKFITEIGEHLSRSPRTTARAT